MEEYKHIQSTELIYAATVGNTLIDTVEAAARVFTEISLYKKVNQNSGRVFIENFRALYLYSAPYVEDEEVLKRVEDLFRPSQTEKNTAKKPVMPRLPPDTASLLMEIMMDSYRHELSEYYKNHPDKSGGKEESHAKKDISLRFDGKFTERTVYRLLDIFEGYNAAIHKSPLMKLIEKATRAVDR